MSVDDPQLLLERLDAATSFIMLCATYAQLEATLRATSCPHQRAVLSDALADLKRRAEAAGERVLQLDAAAKLDVTGHA